MWTLAQLPMIDPSTGYLGTSTVIALFIQASWLSRGLDWKYAYIIGMARVAIREAIFRIK